MPEMHAYSKRRKRKSKKEPLAAVLFPRRGDSAAEVSRKVVFMVSILVLIAATVLLLDFYVFGFFGFFNDEPQNDNDTQSVVVDHGNTQTGTITLPRDPDANGGEVVELQILEKYREFFEANNEFIGYLSLGEHINYPVVWRKHDNDFYLKHNFDGTRTDRGAIFADGWNEFTHPTTADSGRPDNIILHGHNMRQPVRFNPLRQYTRRDTGFEFLQENHVIQFDTLFEAGTYVIFAVAQANIHDSLGEVFPFWQRSDFETSDEFHEYVVELLDRSRFHTDVDLRFGDELLTLSTCDQDMFNPGVRIVVAARRLRPGESINTNPEEFVNLTIPNSRGQRGRDESGFMQYKMFESFYRELNANIGWVGRHTRRWETSRVEGLDAFLARNPQFMDAP
jgi:sortase B